jgi:Peptidase family M28
VKERSWPAWLALTAGVAVAAAAVVVQNPPQDEPVDAYPTVFSATRAMKHVEAIAKEPHPTGSEEIAKVRETLLVALKELKLEPVIQIPKDESRPERNILARLNGKGPRGRKAVLLCAHYDTSGASPGAGDNASGVAAVLETLRALTRSPGLDRDVIVLLDDGEEIGLKGAKLFVDEHPWAKDVGVVLNVDARGNHGPSIMFETSDRNGWLIRQFAEVTPHPVATSLSMDIYRLMPNDTNLSIFKRAGMDGLNFAFCRGLSYYHTTDDTPANLDPRSLQHQGENVLAMTRQFGGHGLEKVREDDVVYCSVLNRAVVYYPAKLAFPFAMGSAGVFVLTVIVGLIMGRIKVVDLLVGIMIWFVAAFVSIVAVGGFWLVVRDMMASVGLIPIKFDLAILTVGSVIAAVVTLGLERLAARDRSIEALGLGALAWWVALALATAQYLPGMSYLFTWPSLFALLGLVSMMMMRRGSGVARESVLIGCLPALLLLPPLIREAFEGLSLQLAGPQMILVVLFLGGVLPLLAPIVVPSKRSG